MVKNWEDFSVVTFPLYFGDRRWKIVFHIDGCHIEYCSQSFPVYTHEIRIDELQAVATDGSGGQG